MNCCILGEKGDFLYNMILEKNMNTTYYKLNCVLEDKLYLTDLQYPDISASTESKLENHLKIFMKAVNQKVKYIILDKTKNEIMCFKYDKYKINGILYVYLYQKFKNELDYKLHPFFYIASKLSGFDDECTKRLFIQRYINSNPPEGVMNAMNNIDENPNISFRDKYLKKYDVIKKYDNFKRFDKMYKEIEKESKKILEDTKKDKKFLEFSKNVKIYELKFNEKNSIGNNPLYTNRLKNVINKYLKNK